MYRKQILNEDHLSVFRFLKEKFMGDALIAGGAVRDQIMGKEFKDIDIWFNDFSSDDLQRFFEISLPKELGFKCGEDYLDIPESFFVVPPGRELRDAGRPAHRDRQPSLINLDDMEREDEGSGSGFMNAHPPKKRRVDFMFSFFFKGTQYQLMRVNVNPFDFIKEEFDVGFCKVIHDGKRIIKTKEFDYDLEHKVFSIDGKKLGQRNFEWCVKRHIPRLKELYPEFKERIVSRPSVEKKQELRGFTSTPITFIPSHEPVFGSFYPEHNNMKSEKVQREKQKSLSTIDTIVYPNPLKNDSNS